MKKLLLRIIGSLVPALCFLNSNAQIKQNEITAKFVYAGNLKFRDFNKNNKLDVYEDYRRPFIERAKDLLSKMTLEEKLAQLDCPYFGKIKLFPHNKFDSVAARKLYPNGAGEMLQLSYGSSPFDFNKTPDPSQLVVLTNETQSFFINNTRLGIPVLFSEEALHGLMVKDGTMFPSALGMASSWNEELSREVFEAIAQEARAIGTHIVLAPVLDLALDPRWGRTEETMGEDPYLTSRLGVAKVKALQGDSRVPDSNHVVANLKHFGAHGQPEGGINKGPVFISERELREVNFKPFKAAIIEGNALSVMPNYNEISGIPTTASKWLLSDVLRKEWRFKGIILSDADAIIQLKDLHHIASDNADAGAYALNAGVDLELGGDRVFANLPEAIKKGSTTIENLNNAVLNILELKFRLGIFERPYINGSNTDLVGSDIHRALALKAARQSMVLLKNENSLLPLDRHKFKRIAIIGPNADQCLLGGYSQMPKSTTSPLAAIKEKYNDVDIFYARGCGLTKNIATLAPTTLISHDENIRLIREAVEAAKNADAIVLMLGGNNNISREAIMASIPGDLANLELLGDQNELIDSLKKLNKPMAAFVFSGPPISFLHLQKSVSAIVQSWYLGQETGDAVAETLFGDNNPSGKLAISIPRSAAQLPDYYFAKPSARDKNYNLDSIAPLYPFGFGLSYTKYEYSNLRISKSTISAKESPVVTIDVTNTGQKQGEEIIQLYIRDKVSSITRPVKELKDFARIPLAPGETKRVSFTITPDKLKFYDINMKEVIEPGDFDIMVGPSSQDLQTINLKVL